MAKWELLGAADFNGDGRADMVFRRKSDGMLSLYLMDGFQVLQAQLLGATGADWRVRAVADFNGDGRADIVFRRTSDGMLSARIMHASTCWPSVSILSMRVPTLGEAVTRLVPWPEARPRIAGPFGVCPKGPTSTKSLCALVKLLFWPSSSCLLLRAAGGPWAHGEGRLRST
jgi:hypothetical protein